MMVVMNDDEILKSEKKNGFQGPQDEETKLVIQNLENIEFSTVADHIGPPTREIEEIEEEGEEVIEEIQVNDRIMYSEELKEEETFVLNIRGEFAEYTDKIKSPLIASCQKHQREECLKYTKDGYYIDICLRGILQEICSKELPNHSIIPKKGCRLEWGPCFRGSPFFLKELGEKNEKILYNEDLVFWDSFRVFISSNPHPIFDKSFKILINSCQAQQKECFQYSLGPYYIKICMKGLLLKVCGNPEDLTESIISRNSSCILAINSCQ